MNAPGGSPPRLRLESVHTGEVLELRRRRRGGEVVLELRGHLPPGREGPPLHVHHAEDEEGRVLAGRLGVELGDRRFELGAGETATLPRGVPHRWWNAGRERLEFEGLARPVVDLDRYLQAIFEIANAAPPGRPSLVYLAHAALRHRRTQTILVVPSLVRALLFPVVVAAASALGRYRGTAWPGCPARCPGAPGPD